MRFPAGETVVRWRALLVTDRYGAEVRDWDHAVPTPIDGCAVALGARGNLAEQLTAGRDAVISDLTVYMPPGADVLATDRLEIRSEVYEVVGEPFGWRNPWSGLAFGVVVNINRVEG